VKEIHTNLVSVTRRHQHILVGKLWVPMLPDVKHWVECYAQGRGILEIRVEHQMRATKQYVSHLVKDLCFPFFDLNRGHVVATAG
jgi:hypothetical protein